MGGFAGAIKSKMIKTQKMKNGGIVVIMVKLSVKFTTVFIVRIRVGRVAFGLVEDVGSLVLLAHAVNDEHDEQNGAEQTHHGSPDHGCKQTLKTFFEIIRLNGRIKEVEWEEASRTTAA